MVVANFDQERGLTLLANMERIRAFEEQALLAAERDKLVLGAIHESVPIVSAAIVAEPANGGIQVAAVEDYRQDGVRRGAGPVEGHSETGQHLAVVLRHEGELLAHVVAAGEVPLLVYHQSVIVQPELFFFPILELLCHKKNK